MRSAYELGDGPPLVLVPGIPGPWQYTRRTVDALATSFRVLTVSLGSACTIEGDIEQIDRALDDRHIDQAIVCGISFGGLVALRFAAARPERTRALVLASAPGPGTTLKPRHRTYAKWPYVFGPLFIVETPLRLRREVSHALPLRADRWAFAWAELKAFFTAGISLREVAQRACLMEQLDIAGDCERVVAPTLVVTGEPALDWVVPVDNTMGYMRSIRGARHVLLDRTGHLGAITRPDAFAAAVRQFADTLRTQNDEVA
jgi:pimeloyl-ACP methyl ester carboxylesterase